MAARAGIGNAPPGANSSSWFMRCPPSKSLADAVAAKRQGLVGAEGMLMIEGTVEWAT